MYAPDDTIVAVATPPGRGGLGVVRLSGRRAHAIARLLIEGGRVLEPRLATLVRIAIPRPPDGSSSSSSSADTHASAADDSVARGHPDLERETIDEAVATLFPAGASYTGEEVVELSLHGSPVILGELVLAARAAGARLARPGEFTLRAFLSGRLDLTRAEAVRDLVDATTPAQARAAFDQLSGSLAERIGAIERVLFDLRARLEASADFPDEGYHFVRGDETRSELAAALERIEALLAGARRGRLIREGVSVAIVGRTNVGKSTLFNRLAGAERAIVTAVPGTTRDVLTESVLLLGTRMLLADTAGMRETSDAIEREGVARAEKASAAADVVVVVLDASEPLTSQDRDLIAATRDRPRVVVLNKSDLRRTIPAGRRPAAVSDGTREEEWRRLAIELSALTGDGVDALVRAVGDVVGLGHQTEHVQITNERHVSLLVSAQKSLSRGVAALGDIGQVPEEVVLSDIREALDSLQEVSGRRTTDDLLDAIFSRFCIGK